MTLYDKPIDNPDQRIAMDVGTLAFHTIGLCHTLFQSILQFFSFSIILWELSGNFPITLLSQEISIPGYMMWIAIIYAYISTIIVFKIGKPLIKLDFLQENLEANF